MYMPLFYLIGELFLMLCGMDGITPLEQDYILNYLNTNSAGPFEWSELPDYSNADSQDVSEKMERIFQFLENEPDISRLDIIWSLLEVMEIDGTVSDKEKDYFYLFVSGLQKVTQTDDD